MGTQQNKHDKKNRSCKKHTHTHCIHERGLRIELGMIPEGTWYAPELLSLHVPRPLNSTPGGKPTPPPSAASALGQASQAQRNARTQEQDGKIKDTKDQDTSTLDTRTQGHQTGKSGHKHTGPGHKSKTGRSRIQKLFQDAKRPSCA